MFFIGFYCNLLIETLVDYQRAYNVNSMFLLHSPFEALPYLTYPFISCVAFVLYFITFAVSEIFAYKKGLRWYNRFLNYIKKRKSAR